MKKSNTISYISFAVLALMMVMTSCSKYEEGSKFTVLSKKQRVVNTWTVLKVTSTDANGNVSDITSLLPDITVDIKKDGTSTTTSTVGSLSETDEGTWAFSSDKLSLITTNSDNETTTSTIIKLKSNEMKTSTVENNATLTVWYETK